ncbi:excalibur calcium-binding domain-containing protein [Mycolicibacterium phlei]|uniref:excalibur calcium-binding domain-containing protein n=1 Tax=Mycolicibacterium phlei TaxID=1771 RepID=UPI00025AD1AA|nr:excalibur calcium-binding domain-containing protein [Mycolicibacterium phlei]EID17846.1 putative calcium-binding protein [Mycolicibacterium phlei RIVM601174]MBF4191505.1 putative calcium-binding protein [Mycolicibacterium phlei]
MTGKFFAAVALVAALGGVAAPAIASAEPYKNCTEARQNGDTNIPASSDKYGSHLDRDGDGIACES